MAAAEDFDPLRIRPYVTLDTPEGPAGPYEAGAGAGGSFGAGAGTDGPSGAEIGADRSHGAGIGTDGSHGAGIGAGGSYGAGIGAGGHPTAHLPAYSTEDPPTAQLAAIRPESDLTAPIPAAYAAGGQPGGPGPEPYSDHMHPGAAGDPSETMPLLLRGIGDVPPARGHEQARARGRKRGVMVAAVAAVAVAGTAALAAAVLGGADETDDRAAVPEVTTSASLNVAVSEAPSPSSETPEPTTSSPTPQRTTDSPSPAPTRTTTSPSAAAPPAAPSSAAPTTAAPTTATPSTQPPRETEEAAVTLNIGSSGDEVVELQARLTLAGAYHGDVDGQYDQEVWRAVKSYQSWMYIEGDPKGVYGPHTREALERSTWL
ncbi:peptidoglycan-binding domain-containing protein [Streptomyces sp. NPDC049602]|uniref:peptidoglycan-binding domain-containing protein n=1 Tax=Streptomyces sp. NPDC049602 TaxID=3155504 RepID=UPI00342D04D9